MRKIDIYPISYKLYIYRYTCMYQELAIHTTHTNIVKKNLLYNISLISS